MIVGVATTGAQAAKTGEEYIMEPRAACEQTDEADWTTSWLAVANVAATHPGVVAYWTIPTPDVKPTVVPKEREYDVAPVGTLLDPMAPTTFLHVVVFIPVYWLIVIIPVPAVQVDEPW